MGSHPPSVSNTLGPPSYGKHSRKISTSTEIPWCIKSVKAIKLLCLLTSAEIKRLCFQFLEDLFSSSEHYSLMKWLESGFSSSLLGSCSIPFSSPFTMYTASLPQDKEDNGRWRERGQLCPTPLSCSYRSSNSSILGEPHTLKQLKMNGSYILKEEWIYELKVFIYYYTCHPQT